MMAPTALAYDPDPLLAQGALSHGTPLAQGALLPDQPSAFV